MADIDRREFAGLLTAVGLRPGMVVPAPSESSRANVAAEAPADVTRTLARYVVRARPEDVPAPVVA